MHVVSVVAVIGIWVAVANIPLVENNSYISLDNGHISIYHHHQSVQLKKHQFAATCKLSIE